MLVIECKRAKDTEWIFLRDPTTNNGADDRLVSRAWITALKVDGRATICEWSNIAPVPGSPIGDFCIVRKNGQRTQELLERTAAEVVRATEAVAKQEAELAAKRNERLSRVYLPFIVTTAKLYVCDIDLQQFDPAQGEVADANFRPFSVVRFSKSFSSATGELDAKDICDLASQVERSVLVVQAGSFLDFLRRWNIGRFDGKLTHELFGA